MAGNATPATPAAPADGSQPPADATTDPANASTPPAAPTPNSVVPQAPTSTPDPIEDGSDPSEDEDSGESGDLGFPAHTALKDMTDAQQAAYWRNLAKKKQKEVKALKKGQNPKDQIVTNPATPATPAAPADPATPPAPDASTEPPAVPSQPPAPVDAVMNRRILIAEVRASIPSLSREDITNTVDLLDVSKFFQEDGDLNEEAVNTLVGRLASNPTGTFEHNPAKDIFGGGSASPTGGGTGSIKALAARRQAELAAAKAPRSNAQ